MRLPGEGRPVTVRQPLMAFRAADVRLSLLLQPRAASLYHVFLTPPPFGEQCILSGKGEAGLQEPKEVEAKQPVESTCVCSLLIGSTEALFSL